MKISKTDKEIPAFVYTPNFSNIMMHSDNELADVLGMGIVKRKTIHECFLS